MNDDQNSRERSINPSENNADLTASVTTIPVIHEQVKVEKKVVETGRVHIKKSVHEEVDLYNVALLEEQVTVERIPINQYVDTAPPAIRYEGEVMIIPVLKEVAVVVKRIMLVEELHVTKHKSEKKELHEATLRKEEIEITRTGPINTPR
jgi:uncharacterized protein (TIGR02271 family)